jgi:hypothetical protein
MPVEIIVGAVVGAAAATAVKSESFRAKIRRAAVLGLAGLLIAGDKIAALTKGAVDGARQVVKEAEEQRVAPAANPTANGAADNFTNNGATKPAETTKTTGST